MHLVEENQFRRKKRKSFIGQSALVLMGIIVLFFTAFTSISLPTPTISNLREFSHEKAVLLYGYLPDRYKEKVVQYAPAIKNKVLAVEYSSYCPYVPVAVLVGYVLGPFMAVSAAAAFVVLGLVGPLVGIYAFAQGGGLNYYLEPGFGYLIGLILGAWLTGKITVDKRTSLSQLAGLLVGIISVHLVGAAYLFGTYLFFYIVEGSKTFLEWQPFIFKYLRNFTWNSLPFDFAFAIMAVGLAFPFRFIVNVLTSPDVAPRERKVTYNRRVLEEIGSK